jgi:murein L,D-transpeptidase YcbB/YkuD
MDPATRLTALILLFARAIAADDGDPASELLRARVEQIREDPAAMVGGVHIAARRALPLLYERRQFAPTWTDPAARDDLIREIEESERDGLEPEDYLRSPLAAARQRAEAEGSPLDARVDYDLMLTDALARLLYHLIYGKVDPRDFDPHWNFTREIRNRDPASFLQEMIDSGDLASRIDAEKPDHYIYRGLVAELARCRELAAHGGFPVVPAGAALERGAHGARVAALRARLEASGDLAAGATGGEEFDEAIETAVQGFQKSRGLTADGRVGPGTLAALNVPIERRSSSCGSTSSAGRWLLHDLASGSSSSTSPPSRCTTCATGRSPGGSARWWASRTARRPSSAPISAIWYSTQHGRCRLASSRTTSCLRSGVTLRTWRRRDCA